MPLALQWWNSTSEIWKTVNVSFFKSIHHADASWRCKMFIYVYLPGVQLSPSPKYPGRQAQVELPGVLVQLALALQPPLFSAHSSISERSQTSACHQWDKCGTIGPMYGTAILCAEFYHRFRFPGTDRLICVRGRHLAPAHPAISSFLSSNLLLFSLDVGPLNQLRDLRVCCKLHQREVRGGATGDNLFEYSEVHVLQ